MFFRNLRASPGSSNVCSIPRPHIILGAKNMGKNYSICPSAKHTIKHVILFIVLHVFLLTYTRKHVTFYTYKKTCYALHTNKGDLQMTLQEYKAFLIADILEWAGDRFTREYLEKQTSRTLERIYDNC